MRTKNNRVRLLLSSYKKYRPAVLGVVMLFALALSACGGNADATPTISVEAIYTSAAQTFSAQAATQLALTPPTSTPTATPFPTLPPPPTLSSTFGSPTSSTGGGAAGCDSSVYVSDVTIPDGTVVDAGKKFVKTWAIMNKGTCTWNTSYKLTQIDGDDMGGTPTPLTISVPPGQQVQISVNLIAPTKAGNYTAGWQMQNAQGQNFGNKITVVIKVGNAATDTPGAATDTPGAATDTTTP